MRFSGTLTSWNAERGFGFITPDQGGQDIFVHITAFPARSGPPQLHQRLSFEVALHRDGKKRAVRIEAVRPARVRSARPPERPARWGASGLAIPTFALLYLAVALLWRVSPWVAAWYGAASLVCFMAYAFDKSAATAGRWRTAERTLLLLGLVGGWPGGLVAQQLLRHKTSKPAFRAAFWGTVVLNVAAFVAIHSPLGQAWRA